MNEKFDRQYTKLNISDNYYIKHTSSDNCN